MSLPDQLLGQIRHDTFGSAVERRRNTFDQWSDLRDLHGLNASKEIVGLEQLTSRPSAATCPRQKGRLTLSTKRPRPNTRPSPMSPSEKRCEKQTGTVPTG